MKATVSILYKGLLLWGLTTFGVSPAAWAQAQALYCSDTLLVPLYDVDRDLKDTLQSLEAMRGRAGLWADTIYLNREGGSLRAQVLNPNTSPTNIALDLLIHAELTQAGAVSPKNILSQVLSTLAALERHAETGLFYSRYSSVDGSVSDYAVSSIDNFHLALALWTAAETFPQEMFGEEARSLFDGMDFSVFVDTERALIGGNLKPAANGWEREAYNFAHLGSEARALYSAGWALGLFRSHTGSEFIERALSALTLEVYRSPHAGNLMRLWDGAAFQLYFPKVFIGEESYSTALRSIYSNTAYHMIFEGERRGLMAPAAHTASRASVEELADRASYQDKSGDKLLVSLQNQDLKDPSLAAHWDTLFSPHVLFMATSSEQDLLHFLSPLKAHQSNGDFLFVPGWGWMDALHVSGPLAGKVVPVQLSLNQGMLALSALALKAPDRLSISARALRNNPRTRQRLQYFYDRFDLKW